MNINLGAVTKDDFHRQLTCHLSSQLINRFISENNKNGHHSCTQTHAVQSNTVETQRALIYILEGSPKFHTYVRLNLGEMHLK